MTLDELKKQIADLVTEHEGCQRRAEDVGWIPSVARQSGAIGAYRKVLSLLEQLELPSPNQT